MLSNGFGSLPALASLPAAQMACLLFGKHLLKESLNTHNGQSHIWLNQPKDLSQLFQPDANQLKASSLSLISLAASLFGIFT